MHHRATKDTEEIIKKRRELCASVVN